MAVLTKDELKTALDTTLTDGGQYTAQEGRDYNDDLVDSIDALRTSYGESKGSYKGNGNSDLSADENGDVRQIIANGITTMQIRKAGVWTTCPIVIPYGVKLLFKKNGNTDYTTNETGDTYWQMDAEGTVEQVTG